MPQLVHLAVCAFNYNHQHLIDLIHPRVSPGWGNCSEEAQFNGSPLASDAMGTYSTELARANATKVPTAISALEFLSCIHMHFGAGRRPMCLQRESHLLLASEFAGSLSLESGTHCEFPLIRLCNIAKKANI